MKTFPAKFAGTCSKCHERFAKGTTIAYDGKAWHPACLESEKATEERYYAEKEAADRAHWAECGRRSRAGENISSSVSPDEAFECLTLRVRGAYNYEDAKSEAWAVVYSIRAAGGTADLLKHKSAKTGKWHYGRPLGHWTEGLSSVWIDGGTGFRLLVNETFAEWKAYHNKHMVKL